MPHTSVLLQEALAGLNLKEGDVFLDATIGSGGHTLEVCKRFGSNVHSIGIDADPERIAEARTLLEGAGCKADIAEANFRNLDEVLREKKISKVNAILFDLGLNTGHLEHSGRGFSFLRDEPLLMTFGEPKPGMLTARDILNTFDEQEIARIIYEFGEERYSRRIARVIVETRKLHPIQTTGQLVELLSQALPKQYERGRIHFATRTFQALRMAVNDELGALSEGIEKGFHALLPEGRMAVISFHSSEDRIVKNYFREQAGKGEGELITKKPLTVSDAESRENPRARSARLRIIQKTDSRGNITN
ncbi:MAG TPA: 16S rRNA (cytosine(1402)-N(4))-methyltransferase RsmH [Candidatus Paceibacterota bacterium]